MSTRTRLAPTVVIPSPQGSPAGGNSMAANITSATTILQSISTVSYAVTWTGSSPVGTISVQVSNDCTVESNGTVTGGTWNPLPLTVLQSGGTSTETTIPISGNTGQGFIDVDITGAYACQLIYTAASGSGNLTVTVSGKVQ